jgi:hypothetical protein
LPWKSSTKSAEKHPGSLTLSEVLEQ